MNDILIYVVSPILSGVIGGIGWLFVYFKGAFEKERTNVDQRLEKLEKRQEDLLKVLLECDQPGCITRKKAGEILKNGNKDN